MESFIKCTLREVASHADVLRCSSRVPAPRTKERKGIYLSVQQTFLGQERVTNLRGRLWEKRPFDLPIKEDRRVHARRVYFVINLLSQLIFIFPLFLGMVLNANEFETKEIQKLTEIKKLTATYIK